MYSNPWESLIGSCSPANVRGVEQPCFESIESPFNIVAPLQTSADFRATKSWMSFHHHDPQIDIPTSCFELPNTIDSPFPFSQSTEDNFTVNTNQDPPTSQFTSSLLSLVESFLCDSEDNFSSLEKYSEFPSNYSEKCSDFPGDKVPLYQHFPQENKSLASYDAAAEEKTIQRNKPEKQFSRSRPWLPPSASNSVPWTPAPTRKRRIRWTKDLHEQFISIVNRLGGPEKAKPRTILKMMNSDGLTASQVKSHLQNYRSTICIQKALQDRPGEGNRSDGVAELRFEIPEELEGTVRQLQLEVQRSLDEQREMQRHLRMLIEQSEQINLMLPKAKKQTGNASP